MAQTPRPSDGVLIGQVFQGKYRVESILGQGGMGVVLECTHLQLNERVALKMLRHDVLRDHDAVERFMREAQAAVKLKSEYVARVSDVGTFEESGTPYMVMEFLEGHDLGAMIAERGTLPVPWAVELILQTAEALAEAHSLGIVHRDVKPANLFVTWRPDGTALIKVLDFGISKSPMGTDMQLTQTQSLLGTPAYMSPEQMRSARLVDARTDMWSLGTVLYELLEGRKPFEAESFSEMCVKVAVDPPAPMKNVSPELQEVVMRCLAKSPEQRYGTMADLGRELVPFSQDPHQASMLVERMQRMLRRSQAEWEGSTTGVGMRGVPNHVRDIGSAPVRAATPASAWHGGTDPAVRLSGGSDPQAARWHGGSEPAGSMFRTPLPGALGGVPLRAGNEGSAPAHAPSAIHAIAGAPRRTRFAFVLIGAALAGIAGVALVMNLGGGADDPRPSSATTVPDPAPVEVAPTPDRAGADVPAAGDGSGSGSGSATPAVATDVVTPPVVDDPVPPTGKTAKTVKKTGKTGKTGGKKDPVKDATKEPAKEPVKDPVPAGKSCNPFDNPHGCPDSPKRPRT